jgi:hypothetical protein
MVAQGGATEWLWAGGLEAKHERAQNESEAEIRATAFNRAACRRFLRRVKYSDDVL